MPKGDDSGAPLQKRRRRIPRLKTETVSESRTRPVFAGIPHTVEGRSNISQKRRSGGYRMPLKSDYGPSIGMGPSQFKKDRDKAYATIASNKRFNKAEAAKFAGITAQRKAEDAARARIKPIADPESQEAARKKKASRRRMRGRMGTILTDKTQSLGAKGTLG
jgi:hypothetical protein